MSSSISRIWTEVAPLADAQLAKAEFKDFIGQAADGHVGLDFDVMWGRRDSASGSTLADLVDLPDFGDLRKIIATIRFAGDNKLELTLQGPGSFIQWRGATAANGARVAMHNWNRFRGRAKISGTAVRYLRWTVAAGVVSALTIIAGAGWFGGQMTPARGAAAAALAIFGLVFWVTSRGKRSTFRAVRVRFSPFQHVTDRPAWREPVFVINLILQILSLLVAVVGAARSIL